MRSFELIAASIFLAAGAWVANAGGTTGIEIDPIVTGATMPAGDVYVMRAPETATTCSVVKGATASNGLAPVVVHGGCEEAVPAVSRIRYWRDRNDGSVELVGEGREAVIVFGVGDGVEFESYRPVSPMLSLSLRG